MSTMNVFIDGVNKLAHNKLIFYLQILLLLEIFTCLKTEIVDIQIGTPAIAGLPIKLYMYLNQKLVSDLYNALHQYQ